MTRHDPELKFQRNQRVFIPQYDVWGKVVLTRRSCARHPDTSEVEALYEVKLDKILLLAGFATSVLHLRESELEEENHDKD